MLQQYQIRSAYTDGSVNAARAGRKSPLTYIDKILSSSGRASQLSGVKIGRVRMVAKGRTSEQLCCS